jgi:hypothetical protein
MPSLEDFMELARKVAENHGLDAPEKFYNDLSDRSREAWPGGRIYLMPKNSQRDPARSLAISSAARRLPTGIVSDRLGISKDAVLYHLKKSKLRDA